MATIPNDQLDSLVAPIALYPDPLLAQTLAASTYPIEIMQLGQWIDKNKDLKDQALADAVAKQPWDPSVQAMAAFPEVASRMAANIQWTSDMGNAFLAQQGDVMDAVQRMRVKAESKGALKTSSEQTVERKASDGEEVIVIEQSNPSTVYVPSYDPAVVYGEPAYPYPSYSYPGYIAGGALAFGGAVALGAAWGNNWGWGCGWDEATSTSIVNNNYVNTTIRRTTSKQVGAGKWSHNPEHRGNAPYGDRGTADKFGGRAASGAGGPRWSRWSRWRRRRWKTWRCRLVQVGLERRVVPGCRWRWKARRSRWCRWSWEGWRSGGAGGAGKAGGQVVQANQAGQVMQRRPLSRGGGANQIGSKNVGNKGSSGCAGWRSDKWW